MDYDKQHITKLAKRLYEGISSQVDEIVLNGPGDLEGADRYIGNLNLSFAYVEGESLIMGLKVSSYSIFGFYSCDQYLHTAHSYAQILRHESNIL